MLFTACVVGDNVLIIYLRFSVYVVAAFLVQGVVGQMHERCMYVPIGWRLVGYRAEPSEAVARHVYLHITSSHTYTQLIHSRTMAIGLTSRL